MKKGFGYSVDLRAVLLGFVWGEGFFGVRVGPFSGWYKW